MARGTSGSPPSRIRRFSTPGDAIVRVRLTAICGSDLHLYGGFIPTMKAGDVLGHEFLGEVVEVGSGVRELVGGRPRRRAVRNRVRTVRLVPARSVVAVRELEPRNEMLRTLYGYAGAGCSATRICTGDSPADRPSTCACRSPTSGR